MPEVRTTTATGSGTRLGRIVGGGVGRHGQHRRPAAVERGVHRGDQPVGIVRDDGEVTHERLSSA